MLSWAPACTLLRKMICDKMPTIHIKPRHPQEPFYTHNPSQNLCIQNGRVEFATKEVATNLYNVEFGESVAPELVLSFRGPS